MNETKLSKQQRKILGWIHVLEEAGFTGMGRGRHFWSGNVGLRELRRYCFSNSKEKPPTRSQSASFSRAVRSLEKRGLIRLENSIRYESIQRTEGRLTEEGSKLAKSLVTEEMRRKG